MLKGTQNKKKSTKSVNVIDTLFKHDVNFQDEEDHYSNNNVGSDDDSGSAISLTGAGKMLMASARGRTEIGDADDVKLPAAIGGTPDGDSRLSIMSPITTMDMSSAAASFETNNSVLETNEQIRKEGRDADNEIGDGGDSDDEGQGWMASDDLEHEMMTATKERSDGGSQEEERNVRTHIDDWHPTTAAIAFGSGSTIRQIPGAPPGWTPPMPPLDYDAPLGFDNIDNPGNYHPFNFRPKMKKVQGKRNLEYQGYYTTPSGAAVVPKTHGSKRIDGEYRFFYNGWYLEDTIPMLNHNPYKRVGATRENPFPKERDGCLDGNLLTKLGLTRDRMIRGDALFFYQLLLPICELLIIICSFLLFYTKNRG